MIRFRQKEWIIWEGAPLHQPDEMEQTFESSQIWSSLIGGKHCMWVFLINLPLQAHIKWSHVSWYLIHGWELVYSKDQTTLKPSISPLTLSHKRALCWNTASNREISNQNMKGSVAQDENCSTLLWLERVDPSMTNNFFSGKLRDDANFSILSRSSPFGNCRSHPTEVG